MLALPEDLYLAIQRAAAPITLSERPRFLQELAAELERHPVIGPGLVHRCVRELQKKFAVEAQHGFARRASAGGAVPPRLHTWILTAAFSTARLAILAGAGVPRAPAD
jgi:hypothetical protein